MHTQYGTKHKPTLQVNKDLLSTRIDIAVYQNLMKCQPQYLIDKKKGNLQKHTTYHWNCKIRLN